MDNVRKLKPVELTRAQVDEAAKEIITKESLLAPNIEAITKKVNEKWFSTTTFHQKNITYRKIAQGLSFVCAIISLLGASFGVSTFIKTFTPITVVFSIVCVILLGVLEFGFRYYSDKYYDTVFLFQSSYNQYLIKFCLCLLISASSSSVGMYRYNMNNHAPDPSLVAMKEDLTQATLQLEAAKAAHKEYEYKNTVKSGQDKGEIHHKAKDAVKRSYDNILVLEAQITRLREKTAGQLIIDPAYSTKVYQESVFIGFIVLAFIFVYIMTMRYMSYFDIESYKEANAEEYLALLAKKNKKQINFQ